MQKIVSILGIGESGIGAGLLAHKLGYKVFFSDKSEDVDASYIKEMQDQGFEYELGQHDTERILTSDFIIKSPGIPPHIPILQEANNAQIPVLGEIEWAYRHMNEEAKIIAVTGSNGKTTTTSLCYRILKDQDVDVALVGNIGYSFARQIALDPKDFYVLEVSSFQLDDTIDFRPDIAILLNITPDHLDRYGYDMHKYIDSKFQITKNQTPSDHFIYNLDDEMIVTKINTLTVQPLQTVFTMNKAFNDQYNGESYIDSDGNLIITMQGREDFSVRVDKLGLRGRHNTYNSMAASIPARIMDLRNEKIRKSMMDYKGLEHRLEFVATVKGVDYINDSKATNLNSVWYALECMNTPTILILGGVDKGNDYNIIYDLVKEKVKDIIALGVDNEKITSFFEEKKMPVKVASSMGTAISLARDIALPGDTVLLSPACASFDLFDNYEDRGHQFKNIVKSL